jgi:uncharacterized glyoxalase superfamily protein PhnB
MTPATVFPALVCDDAPALIEQLVEAFGFEKVAVHGDGDVVHHAELRLGNGLVMLGSAPADPSEKPWGRLGPTAVCVYVEDPDAHHERAVAAGMRVVVPLSDTDYGARAYSALDAAGNVWTFGTYQPLT